MKRTASLLLALTLVLPAAQSHAQSAVDEHAVKATVGELDAAIDAKDWAAARALLLDEITVALPGEEPGGMAADALVARWQDALHEGKTTFHLRGGERVTFDGADSVVLRSKAMVTTRLDGIAGDALHVLRSDYHHELDRTENGWRIRHYGYVPRLESGNVAVAEHRLAASPTGAAADEAGDEANGEAAGEMAEEALPDRAPAAGAAAEEDVGENAADGSGDSGAPAEGDEADAARPAPAPDANDTATPGDGAEPAAPDEAAPADDG